MTAYRLFAEEYILSLLLIDQTTAAVAMQEEAFPDASGEEMDVRFDSGLNGLLSKKLMAIKDDSHELGDNFHKQLTRMAQASRTIKFQVADGLTLKTVSLFLGEQTDVHIMEHHSRVHTIFPIEELTNINELVNFIDKEEEMSFSIPEPKFDQLVSQLLAGNKISLDPEVSKNVPMEFLNTLIEKSRKLNSIFDFHFDHNRDADSLESYLYLTGRDKTWLVEQQENDLVVVHVKPLIQVLEI